MLLICYGLFEGMLPFFFFFAVRGISNLEGRQDWAGPHRHDWKTSCALIH